MSLISGSNAILFFRNSVVEPHYGLSYRIVVLAFVVAATVPVLIKGRPDMFSGQRAGFSDRAADSFWVGVTGKVVYPGVYRASANNVADSVMKMAVPLSALNSAAIYAANSPAVKAGDEIAVEMNRDGTAGLTIRKMPAAKLLLLEVPLDINEMKESDFDRLAGIGPVLAKRIYQYRQKNGGIMSVDELKNVEGVGEIKYSKIEKNFK